MAFGAFDIPTRGVEDARKVLSDIEQKLGDAKARRDKRYCSTFARRPPPSMLAIGGQFLRRAP
jgi:hypothetical protein